MLRLENILTRYGKVPMLRNVSIAVKKGEVVCLLGSNGAGKTTTLKAILRLIPVVEGSIFLNDQPIHQWKTHRIIQAGVSVVPEGRRIFPKMSVLENLKLGAFTEGNPAEVASRLGDIYQLFPHLSERQRQLGGTLSGGEQAMVAISRGLMGRPKVLLLDEPSLGLAPVLVEDFFKAIKKINDSGVSILLIEQNARKALSIASRGYVLQKGEIVVQGTREDLYRNDLIRAAYLRA